MKILKILGILVSGLLVIALVAVFMQPAKGHVEKSIVINAPASAIFPYVNNMKNFTTWSPWSKMDPEAKQTFEGAEAGIGAKMSWSGEKTGKGTQWIETSVENVSVKSGLAMEGMEGTAWAEFKLISEGNGTKVIWTYDCDNTGFKGKGIWLMMGSMLGSNYEDGLKDLKLLVENISVGQPLQVMTHEDSTATK